ncbi:MAG: ZIP family metal transporter [Nitrososphaerota archaeon]|nr:ZIP family metal transporter [Candidatus Bathyarchaeota archaeon]MDW8023898.1 ZIP family metal transporter [Nitrososphaerota archaeon]
MEIIHLGFGASLLAGLATGAGAIPIFLKRNFSDDTLDVLLGFAAGVMLAATAFSLLVPAIELSGPWIAVGALIMGTFLLHFIDRFIPHFHPVAGPEGPPSKLSKIWLFIIAITIHNFPEGLAVGVSFGSGEVAAGLVVATAIGLQNAPEGLAVALPLLREKYSKWRSLGYATLTGLVEPVGGLIGIALVSLAHSVLPWGLAFAAGAMLFVVVDEMVPESHKKGFGRKATFGFIGGFVIMMLLDSLFA